jgi:hypothetical protein
LETVEGWINNFNSNTFENSQAELIFLKIQLQLVLNKPPTSILSDVSELIINHPSFAPKTDDLGTSAYNLMKENLGKS